MKNQTYSRTSPTDGRRATLGANGKYSRKNNKGYIINQGIGNLNNQGNEQNHTSSSFINNNNTGSTNNSNTGNGGFETGGTNNTSYNTNYTKYDTNNDGYGEAHSLGGTVNNLGYNIFSEYTVDHTQYGTFATADNYTALTVDNILTVHPTAIGVSPSYNQYGLADGMNGYVRYRYGYDNQISDKAMRQFMADRLTNEGVVARTEEPQFENNGALNTFLNRFDDTVYLGNDQESISVGDSIYADANGTPLADGTTNGRANRYWFIHKDTNDKYMVCKVTAGVVTHYYEWRNGPEGWLEFSYTNRWSSNIVLTGNTSHDSLIVDGTEWVGNPPDSTEEPLGELITHNTFADAVADAQAKLNDNYSLTSSFENDEKNVWLDFRTGLGDDAGKYIYNYNKGTHNIRYSLTQNLEVTTKPLSVTIAGQTVSYPHRAVESKFKYLPLYGGMSASFNFNNIGKAVIVMEYKHYTGEIVQSQIVYKNN